MPVQKFVEHSASCGATGVEILDAFYFAPGTPRDRLPTESERSEVDLPLQKALEDQGMVCNVFSVTNNFLFPDHAKRRLELEKVIWGIHQAKRLGAGIVRVFAGHDNGIISEAQGHQWIVENLVKASKLAANLDITLALENHGQTAGKSWQVKAIIEDVRRESGTQALGANIDIGNFVLVDEDPTESVQAIADLGVLGHLKDFQRASAEKTEPGNTEPGNTEPAFESLRGSWWNPTILGQGSVPVLKCWSLLRPGLWSNLEYEGSVDSREAVLQSFAFINNNLRRG